MTRSALVLMLLALSGSVMAEGFSYNFVTASYGTVDFDDLDVDGDGFGIGLSLELNDEFHLFGAYESADLDFGVDVTDWNVGVGFNTAITPVIDVFAQLSYEYVEVDAGFADADDNGYGIGIGLRTAPIERAELYGGVKYVDLSDSGDNTALFLGFLFNVTDTIAVGVNGAWDDDVSSYGLNGRIYFDY